MAWSHRGPGGNEIVQGRERGVRGTRERVGGDVYCAPQWLTVATVAGAGEVLDDLAERTLL